MELMVSWHGGVWFIGPGYDPEPVSGDYADLDQWLASHDATRADLNFAGSRSLEQKFIHDFGPVTSR